MNIEIEVRATRETVAPVDNWLRFCSENIAPLAKCQKSNPGKSYD
jgi:hypothetical protein